MPRIEWPFLASEMLATGELTFRELRRGYEPIYRGVWVLKDAELSAMHRARAAWLWSGRRGVLAGLSAATTLGAKWIDGDLPAELVHTNRHSPKLITVHTDTLLSGETRSRSRMTVTTPARTAFDLGRRLDLEAGVQRIDALMNATGVKVADIEAIATRHPGVRGLAQLRRTLDPVDGGAESLYESLTRLILVQAGFPRPETQIRVFDRNGAVFARLDMGWRRYRVGVDFEGAHHWSDARQGSRDIERFATLPELGWNDIRVTSGMLHRRCNEFLERVGSALIARGCPRTW